MVDDAPMDATASVPVQEWSDVPAEHAEALEHVVKAMMGVVEAQKAHFGRHGRFGTSTLLAADRLPGGVSLYWRSDSPAAYIVAGSHYQTPGSACIVHVGAYDRAEPGPDGERLELQAFGMAVPWEAEQIQCTGGVMDRMLGRQWSTRFDGTTMRRGQPSN
jgi:hypothetical protein